MWGEEMRKSLIFSRNNNSSWILLLFTTILLLLSAVHYSKKFKIFSTTAVYYKFHNNCPNTEI